MPSMPSMSSMPSIPSMPTYITQKSKTSADKDGKCQPLPNLDIYKVWTHLLAPTCS